MDAVGNDFDVVAVVGRLASSPIHGAPVDRLDWTVQAADRVKRWAEAVQADAYHERELARLFPPLSPPAADVPGVGPGGASGEAGETPDGDHDACAGPGGAGHGSDDANGGAGDGGAGAVDAPLDGDGGGLPGTDVGGGAASGGAPDGGAGRGAGAAEGGPGDGGSSGWGVVGGEGRGQGTGERPGAGELGALPALGGKPPESPAEQERVARRSWAMSLFTEVAAAFRAGQVSTAHVDALAAMLHGLGERVVQRVVAQQRLLVGLGTSLTVEVFRRRLRRLVDRALEAEGVSRQQALRERSFLRHWVRQHDQMHCGYFELDPVRGARLFAALEAEITALYASGTVRGWSRRQIAAQALCNVQSRSDVGGQPVRDARPTAAGAAASALSDRSGAGGERGAGSSAAARDGSRLPDRGCARGTGHAGGAAMPPDGDAAPGPDASEAAAAAPEGDAGRGPDVSTEAVVERSGAGRCSAPNRGQLIVLIDALTLRGPLHDRSVCETWSGEPFPVDVAREMLYEAQVTYGLTFNGRLAGLSSTQRLATPKQRVGLRIMYRTCAFPGCDVGFGQCEIHHVVHAGLGGATVLETLVPLCRRRGGHHDLIHDGGWRATIDDARTLTWRTPSGQVHAVSPFVPLAELDHVAESGSPPAGWVSARWMPAPPPGRPTGPPRSCGDAWPSAADRSPAGLDAGPRRHRATTAPTLFDADADADTDADDPASHAA